MRMVLLLSGGSRCPSKRKDITQMVVEAESDKWDKERDEKRAATRKSQGMC